MNMQNFEDLKGLWQQSENENVPSAKEILSKVESNRKKILFKNISLIGILLFTFGFILWIGLHYDFELATTRIGIIITLIAIMIGIIFNTGSISSLIKQSDPTLNNNSYLVQMINYRNNQRRIQTKGMVLYFILLTVGMILYLYEFALRSLTFGIIAYSITLGWIAFNWFYVRKRTIAKQEKEINEQIRALESLVNKMEEKGNE